METTFPWNMTGSGEMEKPLLQTCSLEPLTSRLSTLDYQRLTPIDVDLIDAFISSDGCSGPALQIARDFCVLHDFWYRTHRDFDGTPILKATADWRFSQLIRSKSPFGVFSPMALWRWAAVYACGHSSWEYSLTPPKPAWTVDTSSE